MQLKKFCLDRISKLNLSSSQAKCKKNFDKMLSKLGKLKDNPLRSLYSGTENRATTRENFSNVAA